MNQVFKKKAFVYCSFQIEGYHMYPGADVHPSTATGDYLDVSHLGERHFHYFNFRVHVEVKHEERDIEFIQLRRRIVAEYQKGGLEMNGKSCETLSDELFKTLNDWYPNRDIKIDISEEGINGAYVEYCVA